VAVSPDPDVSVQKITVTDDDDGLRLDRWFRARFPQVTHGRLEKLLRKGEIRVDGGRVRANLRLEEGMVVRIPPLPPPDHERAVNPISISPEDVAALQDRVLYRDNSLIAFDKPPGLAVQGGSGTMRHLDGMLDALQFGAPERPRLVHRLDRDTSGVLVRGVPDPEGRFDSLLRKVAAGGGREQMASDPEGKTATTFYRCMAHADGAYSWLELVPLTGRTHQLRVQLAEAGFPIVGDRRYGGSVAKNKSGLGRGLHLHARELVIPHPEGGALGVAASLPRHMAQSWQTCGWDEPPVAEPGRSPA